MRKVISILIIVLVTTGCSVSRKGTRHETLNIIPKGNESLYESILNQNITARSFYIERAEFRIKSGDEEKTGLGTVKFLMPDKFLIAIKNHAGIEVARIFLTGDSIMLNDRFGKKLYYGSASYLKKKYGVTTAELPVILGDYVNDEKLDSTKINCIDGNLDIDAMVSNLRIKYRINCENGKSISAIPDDNMRDSGIEIKYSEFFTVNNINIPGLIEISDNQNKTVIEIRIQKIVLPWEGTIEFIPGKQYEKIYLK